MFKYLSTPFTVLVQQNTTKIHQNVQLLEMIQPVKFNDSSRMLGKPLSSVTGFVKTHWMEDWYFGYQCLNGCNPLLVRQTRILPPNLSITSDMIHPFLPEGSSLEQELQVCMAFSGFQLFLDAICSLYYSCSIVTERDSLPVELRDFGRRPSEHGQWRADISLRSTVPPSPEPAGTAAPHCHPGELLLIQGKLLMKSR